MPEDVHRGKWTFRRDPRITLPVASLTWSTASGISVLRPEIQLSYKARNVRPKDQADFDAVLPSLNGGAGAWLARALQALHPSHRWIERLQDRRGT